MLVKPAVPPIPGGNYRTRFPDVLHLVNLAPSWLLHGAILSRGSVAHACKWGIFPI